MPERYQIARNWMRREKWFVPTEEEVGAASLTCMDPPLACSHCATGACRIELERRRRS